MRVIMIMWIIVKNRPNLKKCKTIWIRWERFTLSTFHHRKWCIPKQWSENGPWWACLLSLPFMGSQLGSQWEKSGKGKTPWIGIKRLDKIWPKAISKVAYKKKIPAWHKGPRWNLLVSKIDGVTDTETTISMTSVRDLAMRAWVPPNTSRCGIGTTWSHQSIYNATNERRKPLCNTCEACYDFAMRYEAGQKNKGGKLLNNCIRWYKVM